MEGNAYAESGSRAERIVIHFDVNETIMVGDPAGDDTFDDSLNKMIAKSAFVRPAPDDGLSVARNRPLGVFSEGLAYAGAAPSTLPMVWYDGSEIFKQAADGSHIPAQPPPLHFDWEWPRGAVPFYRANRKAGRTFTFPGQPGAGYSPLMKRLKEALRWAHDDAHEHLCHDGENSFLIPAFYHTLQALHENGRHATVVIRTFGTDAGAVCDAVTAFANGKHPAFPAGLPGVAVSPLDVFTGSYNRSTGAFELTHKASNRVISDEEEVVRILEAPGSSGAQVSVKVCTDDYHWWKNNRCVPSAGKPVWVTHTETRKIHHIMFDDNIHNLSHDSIVAIRSRPSGGSAFQPLSGKETLGVHGRHMWRVPTVEPILDPNWFVRKIEESEQALHGKPPT